VRWIWREAENLDKLWVCQPGQVCGWQATWPKPPATWPWPPATLSRPPATLPRPPATLPRPPTTLPRPPATWPVYLRYLSSSCCRLTMLFVDNTHQLCVGFGGKQRIWTSCGYARQVRRVASRRCDPGHLPPCPGHLPPCLGHLPPCPGHQPPCPGHLLCPGLLPPGPSTCSTCLHSAAA
jgi:hypothetical protein